MTAPGWFFKVHRGIRARGRPVEELTFLSAVPESSEKQLEAAQGPEGKEVSGGRGALPLLPLDPLASTPTPIPQVGPTASGTPLTIEQMTKASGPVAWEGLLPALE